MVNEINGLGEDLIFWGRWNLERVTGKYIPTKPLGWPTKVGLASGNAGENLDWLERGFDEFPCWLTKVWLWGKWLMGRKECNCASMINVTQGLRDESPGLASDWLSVRVTLLTLFSWRSINRPQWDKPVIEEDLNNDNGRKVTKEVCGRTLTCLANLTLTDRNDLVELNLGIRVILSVAW